MFTKITLTTAAAAFLLSTASAAFATPKNRHAPEAAYSAGSKSQNSQRIREPLYFQHGTRSLLKATDGDMPY